jgi:hypothetical protein
MATDTASPPELFAPTSGPVTANAIYIAFMIDLDVPLDSSAPNATRRTLLHWFQPNLVSSTNTTSPADILISNNITTPQGAPYIQPSPTVGSGPHRYTLLLFTQPKDFTIPSAFLNISPPSNSSERIGFNITEFISQAGLDSPVAGNYFQVLNGTNQQTSSVTMSFPLATGSVTTTAASLTATATSGASASATQSASAATAVGSGAKELLVARVMGLVGALAWML